MHPCSKLRGVVAGVSGTVNDLVVAKPRVSHAHVNFRLRIVAVAGVDTLGLVPSIGRLARTRLLGLDVFDTSVFVAIDYSSRTREPRDGQRVTVEVDCHALGDRHSAELGPVGVFRQRDVFGDVRRGGCGQHRTRGDCKRGGYRGAECRCFHACFSVSNFFVQDAIAAVEHEDQTVESNCGFRHFHFH